MINRLRRLRPVLASVAAMVALATAGGASVNWRERQATGDPRTDPPSLSIDPHFSRWLASP
jgi:hypothetical protein